MTLWDYPSGINTTTMDLSGYEVLAIDGDIGKVDEASIDSGTACLIVDTGVWIFGKKRMIPAGKIADIDHTERRVYMSLTKDQIKDAPDYDTARKADAAFHKDHDSYYGQW